MSERRTTFVTAASKEGSLIDEVGQVGSGEACGAGSNAVYCHILAQRQALLQNMGLQDLLPPCTHKQTAFTSCTLSFDFTIVKNMAAVGDQRPLLPPLFLKRRWWLTVLSNSSRKWGDDDVRNGVIASCS